MKLRPGTPEEAGMSARRVRHVAELAGGWVSEGLMQALAVVVARRGIVVLSEAFGPLTAEAGSPPLQLDSLFTLASLTKPITATALMILVDEGRVGLNRPVCEYIPEFVGEGKSAVLVHHLLTHTAGLDEGVTNRHAERKQGVVPIPPPEPTAHPEVHEHMFPRYDTPLWKPPGTEMLYSSFGIALLGEIARRVSGKPLADFARERIFEPLGMKDTYYSVPAAVRRRVALRPVDSPDAYLDSIEVQEVPWAGGAAFSSAPDMAVFGQMFLNRGAYGDAEILSPACVAAMTRNQIPGIQARYGEETFAEASWGLGWSVESEKRAYGSLRSPQTFSHGGAGGVFMWVDPTHEIVGVYFALQRERSQVDLFMNAITAAVR
jgi:CubicO group peptidase (beta-lactamase class C family)